MLYRCIDCNKPIKEDEAMIIARFPDTIARCVKCQDNRLYSELDPKFDQKIYRTNY